MMDDRLRMSRYCCVSPYVAHLIQQLHLTAQEKEDMVAFLRSL
jgi:hypothetical protein